MSARVLISLEKVAENSSVWRSFGSIASTFLMSWMKPMSSMRSASSSTRISTPDRSTVFWPAWSSRRPGVATRMSTGLRSWAICGLMPTPPNITIDFSGRYLPYSRTDSSTWAASSRVGVSTSARGRPFCLDGWSIRRCSSGRVKPAVLPVPVCAAASRSPPCKT
ncbi:hypothetical protein D3C85_1449930 [compost metagenome]